MVSRMLLHRWFYFLVTTLVVAYQAYNCFALANELNHLTNWAWLFTGFVSGWYALQGDAPAWLLATALGVSGFVAGGISALMAMDNLMIARYVDELGAGVVHAANVLLHYAPLLLWVVVARYERPKLQRHTAIQALTLPLLFTLLYGTWFDARAEYPGTQIDFTVLYAAGFAAQALAGCALVL